MSVTSFLHYKRPNPWHIVYHLQVIYARFGSKPHIMMIFFALLTNLLIAGMVMSEGSIIMATLTDGKMHSMTLSRCVRTSVYVYNHILAHILVLNAV